MIRINGFCAINLAISLVACSGTSRIKSVDFSTPQARLTRTVPFGGKRLSELFSLTPFLEELKIESSLLYNLNRALQDTSSLPRLRKLHVTQIPAEGPQLTNTLKCITSLATSRCEEHITDNGTTRIDELFLSVELCRRTYIQRQLENWKGHGKEYDHLLELDMRLIALLPELEGNTIPRSRNTHEWKERLSELFMELEALQELDDPRNLAVSCILCYFLSSSSSNPVEQQFSALLYNITYLYHMYSKLPSTSFPFTSRTGEILDTWTPFLINAISTMNWIITEQGIIYLRKDDGAQHLRYHFASKALNTPVSFSFFFFLARRLDQTMINANYGYSYHRH